MIIRETKWSLVENGLFRLLCSEENIRLWLDPQSRPKYLAGVVLAGTNSINLPPQTHSKMIVSGAP
jgi:hypothetical protein